jgi:cytoskeletal protein RodZ
MVGYQAAPGPCRRGDGLQQHLCGKQLAALAAGTASVIGQGSRVSLPSNERSKGKSMSRTHGWLLLLLIMAMLVAACGPQLATPTAGTQGNADSSPTKAPAAQATEPEPSASETESAEPSASSESPVDADDWRVLGSPDAPVTIFEYSDFQ